MQLKVPDLEKRKEAERLWNEIDAAERAREACEDAGSEALEAKYEPLFAAAKADYDKRCAELRSQKAAEAGPDSWEALNAKVKAAEAAYEAAVAPHEIATFHNDDGEWELERCALTGVALFAEDAVLCDEVTGEKILKAALGIPLDEEGAFVLPEGAKAAA